MKEMILGVENLNHGFGERAIFEDVSFRLLKGEKIGLVGANGEGKSTFMDIITKKLIPDEGRISWAQNVRVSYLDQKTYIPEGATIREVLSSAFKYLFDMEDRIIEIGDLLAQPDLENMDELLEEMGTLQDILNNSDFYMIDAKVDEVARGIGLYDLGLENKVADMSGGTRNKILLGRMILENPDILLLDEPTNFLDESHIEWLKNFLNEFENAFILISHDIAFLNSVINLIYHVDNKKITRYVGNYDDFMAKYEENKRHTEAAYKRQQQEIADLKDFVARNKARVATRNMAMSRQKKLDKMEVIELQREKPKPEFNFKNAKPSSKLVYRTEDLVIGYDEPLSSPINLYLEKGMKLAITGSNGIGKTTLIRTLVGEIKPLSGVIHRGEFQQIGYFEQEDKSKNKKTCIEDMWELFPSYTQFEIRSALAKCGLTTNQIESKVFVLSGGEAAKLRLCKIMNRETNILLLDEPSNHLDVDAKADLIRALKEYTGTILLISHEPEFYTQIADEIISAEAWTKKLL